MDKIKQLEKVIQEDHFGTIPIFFRYVTLEDTSIPEQTKFKKRFIKIDAYQTNTHGKKPYRKAISKFI